LFQLFETSAKEDSQANHVESIFMTLAHKLKNSRPMMPVHMSRWDDDSRNQSNDDETVRIGNRSAVHELVENDACSC